MRRILWLGLAVALAALGLTCAPRATEDPPSPKSLGPGVAVADLKELLEQTLKNIKDRRLVPTDGFWTIFHAILGMGLDTELIVEDKGGKSERRVRAIDYIAAGEPMSGLEFIVYPQGLDVKTTGLQGGIPSMSQGHQDQFIAEMAQWGIPTTMPFKIKGYEKPFLFIDFCRYSKARASVTVDKDAEPSKQELTWAIIIIGQFFGEGDLFKRNSCGQIEYLPWTNKHGEKLNYEDVVRFERNEPIEGGDPPTACGGTHRLFGLSWAYHLHLRRGGKTTGLWKEVADKLERYKKAAKEHQNSD